MWRITSSLILISSFAMVAWSWDNIPQIPSNRRSQFYLMRNNGDYEYGYDSGDGSSAQQRSSNGNQVAGSYSFVDDAGRLVEVKYTAGVNGFVPEVTIDGETDSQFRNLGKVHQQKSSSHASINQAKLTSPISRNSDASYKISYDAGNHQREEESDSEGNVQGYYSYVDELGRHDLSYIAGPEIGYQVVGGSLANLESRKESSDTVGNFRNSNVAGRASHAIQIPRKSIKNELKSSSHQSINQQNALFFKKSQPSENVDHLRVQHLPVVTINSAKFEDESEEDVTIQQFPNDHRRVDQAKHLHPSYTIISPEAGQRSFEYGPRNAVILGFLPPKHEERFGYIYDTQ